jgi:hypothetical protein
MRLMSGSDNRGSSSESVEGLLGYFDQSVLAPYRDEPQKYRIESDYFDGRLSTTDEYYHQLEIEGRTDEYVDIRFGYRTRIDGSLALVVWLPDLFEKSRKHLPKWLGFHLREPGWATGADERFEKWKKRYLKGDWEVENGPLHSLEHVMKIINALTAEVLGVPLFKHEVGVSLNSPSAENTHKYQDAHKELYGYLIDGLDKECIFRISKRVGRRVTIHEKKTVDAITSLFPDLQNSATFETAFRVVSEQRRLASHGVRLPAESYPAFSQFTKDLALCVEAMNVLLATIERAFELDGEGMYRRREARKLLPTIDRPPETHYSIVKASRMVGKAVERVEFGIREGLQGVHQSEALIIYFTDGSMMSIETGSNAANLGSNESGLRPEDFHTDFMLNWVPEPLTKKS